ncbi:MAG: B12-binding domain-containing radical SAM protein [Deltaproteobacteria bacterium]|nr:B12-binding domain-containing radical SAM protein [Deltaproteobacteria bacterium]
MRPFKILFLYPNSEMMNPAPISIGIFTALLKQEGCEVDLFDSTLYPDPDKKVSSDKSKQDSLQVRPFDWGEKGVRLKTTRMEEDLVEKVEAFQPDLIAVSVLECTYAECLRMLKAIEPYDIPVLVGGVFATHAPHLVFRNKNVGMVAIGEGEDVLVEVVRKMAAGEDYSGIGNLWIRRNGGIIKNNTRHLVDISKLPIPDFSLFEVERLYRPMAGKVYRTVPVESNRGCPFLCTFCNSPSMVSLYKENNSENFYRKKTVPALHEELKRQIKRWNAEYVYFTSDTFLAISDAEFDQFIEIYKDFRLPFWIQTRPETINRYKAKKLREAGLHRISLGLEHGNAEFRRRVIRKDFDDQKIIECTRILADEGIPVTVNNIIGFPDETRELIFDTIELNRKLITDTTNCSIFAPFHGTPLQKIAVEKGYVEEDFIFGSINVDAPLNMPQLSRNEIKSLHRTFALYAKLPKEYWPVIRKAEKFDDEGNRVFAELGQLYKQKYFYNEC